MRIRNKELRLRRHRKEQTILTAKKEQIKAAATRTGPVKEKASSKTASKMPIKAAAKPKVASKKMTAVSADSKTEVKKRAPAKKVSSEKAAE